MLNIILVILGKYDNKIACQRQILHNCYHATFTQDIEWQKQKGIYIS